MDLAAPDYLDLAAALANAATEQEILAESLHDVADNLTAIDTVMAQRFYQMADQLRACVRQFRLLSAALAQLHAGVRGMFWLGLIAGLTVGWLSHWLF
jgi:hypothetical protein